MEVLSQGQVLIGPGNFAADIGSASEESKGFREVKISVSESGEVSREVRGLDAAEEVPKEGRPPKKPKVTHG